MSQPTDFTLRLSDGEGLIGEATITVTPQRHWTSSSCTHSHLDIGYTDASGHRAASPSRLSGRGTAVDGESEDWPARRQVPLDCRVVDAGAALAGRTAPATWWRRSRSGCAKG
ncbi:hypothetical protein [Nonomuraea dietziae]|uniref:hypothetical protein n=1 Tax=Nonomuraea dietziae TaxID=65515 RepID=UPI0031DA8D4B